MSTLNLLVPCYLVLAQSGWTFFYLEGDFMKPVVDSSKYGLACDITVKQYVHLSRNSKGKSYKLSCSWHQTFS